MDADLRKRSKLLSLVLRHRPEDFGLVLDSGGWAVLDAVLDALAANGTPMTEADVAAIIEHSDKQRFEQSDEGRLIRATHGHSIAVDMAYAPSPPPATLYHGTVARFLESIGANGLVAGRRLYVHLSATVAGAAAVARRRGKPIIVAVDAGTMAADGFEFYLAASGIWLTQFVPARFLAKGELEPDS